MTPPRIGVVICTLNPHEGRFQRVMEALKAQTLPAQSWSLVVVDNASNPPVDAAKWVGWHPLGKVLREPQPGQIAARFCGLRDLESQGVTWCVFVDDDNVLAADYLERVLSLSAAHPQMRSIGAGKISPEFEVEPEPSLKPYYGFLALCDRNSDAWTNLFNYDCLPIGAGMAISVETALLFYRSLSPDRLKMGRVGKSLLSADDTDLALSALDQGFGIGVFKDLSLKHLIPASRVQPEYLKRLAFGIACSLDYVLMRRGFLKPGRFARPKLLLRSAISLVLNPKDLGMRLVIIRGKLRAISMYRSVK